MSGRYEITQFLGHGGMGSVFKAHDRELDRIVALKVIRPELAEDPVALRRFRDEILLAQKVVHRNVARIYDIGSFENKKFISMEYLEGRDLSKVLKDRAKLTAAEAIPIIRQVCEGLEAAHSVRVIHRDLKPGNIMVGPDGTVVITDFGLARSIQGPQETLTAGVTGTPAYMSPEQAQGKPLDSRSDLFSLGIVAYEMLTGERPYQAETQWGSLAKRIQEDAVPAAEVLPEIPRTLNRVVMKCLRRDLETRYQSAREVMDDLEGTAPPARPKWRGRLDWAAAFVLLILAAGLFLSRERKPPPAPKPEKTLALLVADFDNNTGDPVFSQTLEQMFNIALEGASWIASFDRRTARKTAADLRSGDTSLAAAQARLVAIRESIPDVVTGEISRSGDGYQLSVSVIDAASGKKIAGRSAQAPNKDAVLQAVGKLAGQIRKALNPDAPQPQFDPFTAGDIDAAHYYALGQQMQDQGKRPEAIADYQQAIQLDPTLGRAYAGLAVTYRNAGKTDEAIRNFQAAMQRLDRMTAREKYRTRGAYYVTVGEADKAVEEFTRLAREYPADSRALANLALAYYMRHDMSKALDTGRRAAEKYPDNIPYKNNVAFYALSAGDFEQAIRAAGQVLQLNPKYEKAYVALAPAQLAGDKAPEAVKTYQRLAKVSPKGASLAALGLADEALFEGRTGEAIAILEPGAAADRTAGDSLAAALKTVALAHALSLRGERAKAVAELNRAQLKADDAALQYPAALVYLESGRESLARQSAERLARERWALEPKLYSKPAAEATRV